MLANILIKAGSVIYSVMQADNGEENPRKEQNDRIPEDSRTLPSGTILLILTT